MKKLKNLLIALRRVKDSVKVRFCKPLNGQDTKEDWEGSFMLVDGEPKKHIRIQLFHFEALSFFQIVISGDWSIVYLTQRFPESLIMGIFVYICVSDLR